MAVEMTTDGLTKLTPSVTWWGERIMICPRCGEHPVLELREGPGRQYHRCRPRDESAHSTTASCFRCGQPVDMTKGYMVNTGRGVQFASARHPRLRGDEKAEHITCPVEG